MLGLIDCLAGDAVVIAPVSSQKSLPTGNFFQDNRE
jgi:hypothetical protein